MTETQLKLPSKLVVRNKGQMTFVYLARDNPQPDGTIAYRSADGSVTVTINPISKAVWP